MRAVLVRGPGPGKVAMAQKYYRRSLEQVTAYEREGHRMGSWGDGWFPHLWGLCLQRSGSQAFNFDGHKYGVGRRPSHRCGAGQREGGGRGHLFSLVVVQVLAKGWLALDVAVEAQNVKGIMDMHRFGLGTETDNCRNEMTHSPLWTSVYGAEGTL